MAELRIKAMDDLKKLKGWTIEKAFKATDRVAAVAFVLSFPGAERKVMLILDAKVNMGRSGNVVIASEAIQIEVKDIIEEEEG